jgi:hypothetical protein
MLHGSKNTRHLAKKAVGRLDSVRDRKRENLWETGMIKLDLYRNNGALAEIRHQGSSPENLNLVPALSNRPSTLLDSICVS